MSDPEELAPSVCTALDDWERRYDELHNRDTPMPGPWTWEIHDHSMATLCGGGEDAIVGHVMSIGPCPACRDRRKEDGWRWGGCMVPSEPNARLIAAAPDLLEALSMIARMHLFPDDAVNRTTLLAAGSLARAAIAKVTRAPAPDDASGISSNNPTQ